MNKQKLSSKDKNKIREIKKQNPKTSSKKIKEKYLADDIYPEKQKTRMLSAVDRDLDFYYDENKDLQVLITGENSVEVSGSFRRHQTEVHRRISGIFREKRSHYDDGKIPSADLPLVDVTLHQSAKSEIPKLIEIHLDTMYTFKDKVGGTFDESKKG